MSSGGLGTACYGLTKGLSRKNIDITLVLPDYPNEVKMDFAKIISASAIKVKKINSILMPYMTSQSYSESKNKVKSN